MMLVYSMLDRTSHILHHVTYKDTLQLCSNLDRMDQSGHTTNLATRKPSGNIANNLHAEHNHTLLIKQRQQPMNPSTFSFSLIHQLSAVNIGNAGSPRKPFCGLPEQGFSVWTSGRYYRCISNSVKAAG